jgi:hypothetical protein
MGGCLLTAEMLEWGVRALEAVVIMIRVLVVNSASCEL